jgi:hypothetical protein
MRWEVFSALAKVVLHLKAQPDLRAAAEGLGKTYGHLRGNSRAGVDQVVQRLALHAKPGGGFSNGKAQRLDALLPDDPAGVRGVLYLMVIIVPRLSRTVQSGTKPDGLPTASRIAPLQDAEARILAGLTWFTRCLVIALISAVCARRACFGNKAIVRIYAAAVASGWRRRCSHPFRVASGML